ncbi:MAG: tetratricopeptide repeat protein, partial [Gammaproteobacteria bacterium]
GRYSEALGPIKEGIDLYKAQGKTPKENWLLLLRVAYYELQDYRGMVATLNELLKYYPKDSYMLTLAGAYSELGDTKKQLVITEVLYEAGIVTGSQHAVNLANLYLMHDIPYRAAEVLEKAMGDKSVDESERNLRLLSQSWYQAREDKRSIPPLERAANMSGEGELFVRLAQSQLNLDLWDEAIASLNKGISKGGVKRRDKAYVMMGMAHLNKKRLNDAESAFLKARDIGGSKKAVDQWLAFVANEKKRKKSLEQALPDAVEREEDQLLKNIPNSAGN